MIKSLSKYYALIPLVAVCLFFCWRAAGFPLHDFTNYYFGGKLLASGNFSAGIYFPYWFNRQIAGLGHPGLFASYAPNTPFLALVFYPFSMLVPASAKLAFNAISILLFSGSLYRLQRFYKTGVVFGLLIPVVFLVPIKNQLLFGQVYFLLFFLLAESLLAYEKKRWGKTAVFLGLAIFLKVFPVLILLLFLFRKQYRPLFYTVGACMLLLAFSVIFTGWDVWVFYLENVLPKAADGAIATAYVPNYQSVFMFLKTLLVFDATQNPDGLFEATWAFSALILALKACVLSVGYFLTGKSANALFAFSYWILASLLVSPYGSTYSCLLLLPVYFYLAQADIRPPQKVLLTVLLFLANNLPLAYFLDNPFPFSYLRLFLLLLSCGAFVLISGQSVRWKWVMILTAAAAFGSFLSAKSPDRKPAYLLDGSSPVLVYDYNVDANGLTYFYWDEKGSRLKTIPFKFRSAAPLDIRDNQVSYNGKTLTSGKGNKRKPMLIDRKTLIYLSDEDRGIGFYTLRKITIH